MNGLANGTRRVVVIRGLGCFIADQRDHSGRVKIRTSHRMLVVVQPAADQAGDIDDQGSNRGPVFLQGGHRAQFFRDTVSV